MKFAKSFAITLILALLWGCSGVADNRIVLHLRHASEEMQNKLIKEYVKQHGLPEVASIGNKTPGEINASLTRAGMRQYLQPQLGGFISVYGGYTDISNPDGLISFPLRHTSPKVYLAITPKIRLVRLKKNTVSHKEYVVDKSNPTKIYLFEKKVDEEKRPYWAIKEVPVPKDKKVNPLTLVILSNPKNLVIPEGDFLAAKNPQLVLPEVFVVGSEEKEEVLLRNLDIKQYFEQINFEKKNSGETSVQKIIKNL